MEKQDLLQIIKKLRTSEELTHQDMADKLEWGKQTYERMENGRTQVLDLADIGKIAQVFGLTTIELLQGATPEGTAKALLKEAVDLFREAQAKVDTAEQILAQLSEK